MRFIVEKTSQNSLARAGKIETAHGVIETPAFVAVATQAALKGVLPEAARAAGTQALFANTFHLHLSPGEKAIRAAGGLHKFMNWSEPIMTDSGGFQVFSLGAAYGRGVSKVARHSEKGLSFPEGESLEASASLVTIDDDGVTFRSPRDGSSRRLTPESSIAIQHDLSADIILAFDECTSPNAPYEYQREALDRTHDWAERSLKRHQELLRTPLQGSQGESLGGSALFGIVQGGRFQDLREAGARVISQLNFDGFGIGGSFTKADIETAVGWVTAILPEDKPRHLLGIGAVEDIFAGVAAGADTFDCVTPTRLGRHGAVETKRGRLNLLASRHRTDFSPIEDDCVCVTCQRYSRAYLRHLFEAREMLGPTLASIHNLHFFNQLLREIRQTILEDRLAVYTQQFLSRYTIPGRPNVVQ